MAVSSSDMRALLPTTVATGFDTSNVGGAKTASAWSGNLGELLFRIDANPAGGADLFQYAKFFVENNNGSNASIANYGVWINALEPIGSASLVSLVSDNGSDDGTFTALVLGFSAGGAPQSEPVVLNGTTPVNTTATFLGDVRVLLTDTTTGSLKNANGDVTVTAGSELGKVPAGYSSATSEIAIGRESGLDDSTVIATAAAVPSGVTFSRPKSKDEKLVVDAVDGVLAAGEAQGYWVRQTINDGMLPSLSVEFVLFGSGDAI